MMQKFTQRVILTILYTAVPVRTARAQDPPQNFKEFVEIILDLLSAVFPLVIGLILLAFLWGLMRFVFALGSAQDASEGKTIMFWGVIALFVAVSVWGFVAILINTFL